MERRKANQIEVSIAVALGCLPIVACSTSTSQSVQNPQASRELAKALAGYTVGPPVRCIKGYPRTRMEIIDDHTLLFRGGGVVYLQKPPGGCYGVSGLFTTLVTQSWGTNQLCQGDINRLIGNGSGMGAGSCAFGPFVPYSKAS